MEILWAKLLFWKKKTPKYKFHSFEDVITSIEITSGKYAGVIFSTSTVKFSDEFGYPKLSFNYRILSYGKHDEESLQNDQSFVTIMGDILTEIIIKYESPRTNNSEESYL